MALAGLACGETSRQHEAGAGQGAGGPAGSGSGLTGTGAGSGAAGSGAAGSGGAQDCAGLDWGLADACQETALEVFVGTTTDLGASVASAVADLTLGCRTMALDLGAAPGDVTTMDPAEAASQWCEVAIARVGSEVTAKGTVVLSLQPTLCEIDVAAQAACELDCTGGNAECGAQLADIDARCSPGALVGTCFMTCQGTCYASDAEPCECNGSCAGACSGSCDGVDIDQGACSATCQGACGGSCSLQAPGAICPGFCSKCDFALEELVCTDELLPPSTSCFGCESCAGACAAVGLVKPQCALPGLGINASDGIAVAAVASLRATLPVVVETGARCERLLTAAQRLLSVATSATSNPELGPAAAACLSAAVDTLSEAAELGAACLAASVNVPAAVGG
jgi:hypothetical protein